MKRAASIIAVVLSVGCAVAGWRGQFDELFAQLFGATSTARLPAEYQEVEYLESSGTQYIDTGIKVFVLATSIEAQMQIIDGEAFGATIRGVGYYRAMKDGSNTLLRNLSASVSVPEFLTGFDSVKFDGGQIYVNCVLVASYTGIERSSSVNLLLFGHASADGSRTLGKAKFKWFKVWESNTPVRDYVPCIRKSDSVAGMYDLVNGTFATNQGTGSFITGPTVGVSP